MTLDKSGCRRVQFCAKFSQVKTRMPLFCRLLELASRCISEKNFLYSSAHPIRPRRLSQTVNVTQYQFVRPNHLCFAVVLHTVKWREIS